MHGINGIDYFIRLSSEHRLGFGLVNGHLKLPEPRNEAETYLGIQAFAEHLHTLRSLVMEDVPACGLTPDFKIFSKTQHHVSIVYAPSVPLGVHCNKASSEAAVKLHEAVAEKVLIAQYLGVLQMAAQKSPGRADKLKVFLHPLGGGDFNNSWESISKAMALAIEMLDEAERSKLEIIALTNPKNPIESKLLKKYLKLFRKLKPEENSSSAMMTHQVWKPKPSTHGFDNDDPWW